jgi:DNA polymerase-3 subunit gamma/tau
MEMVDNKKNHQAIETLLETLGYPGLKLRLIKSDQLQPLEKSPVPIETSERSSQNENHSHQQNSSEEQSNGAPKVPIDPEEFLNDPLIKKALEVFKGRMLKVESST